MLEIYEAVGFYRMYAEILGEVSETGRAYAGHQPQDTKWGSARKGTPKELAATMLGLLIEDYAPRVKFATLAHLHQYAEGWVLELIEWTAALLAEEVG